MNPENKTETIHSEGIDDSPVWLATLIREKPSQKRNQKGNILTKCFCPKCEKDHYLQMRWIGRGRPRKYCQQCKSMLFAKNSQTYQCHYEMVE